MQERGTGDQEPRSRSLARNVSRRRLPRWPRVTARPTGSGRRRRITTPLLPDDYLHLANPLWSARELRGKIVSVTGETEDSATIRIKPGWGFSFDYAAGRYVGIGGAGGRPLDVALVFADLGARHLAG